MSSSRTRFAILIALLASLAAIPAVSAAATASERGVVDGVAVYLGIVPAEIVRGHPREHPEGEMHGGPATVEATLARWSAPTAWSPARWRSAAAAAANTARSMMFTTLNFSGSFDALRSIMICAGAIHTQ